MTGKKLAAGLCVVLALSLTACGNKDRFEPQIAVEQVLENLTNAKGSAKSAVKAENKDKNNKKNNVSSGSSESASAAAAAETPVATPVAEEDTVTDSGVGETSVSASVEGTSETTASTETTVSTETTTSTETQTSTETSVNDSGSNEEAKAPSGNQAGNSDSGNSQPAGAKEESQGESQTEESSTVINITVLLINECGAELKVVSIINPMNNEQVNLGTLGVDEMFILKMEWPTNVKKHYVAVYKPDGTILMEKELDFSNITESAAIVFAGEGSLTDITHEVE